jgi:hypothetical protein
VADLDRARCGLSVRVGRGPDGAQLAEKIIIGRNRAQAGPLVGVADEQLPGVGGRELGAELAQALPGERRTRGLEQPATGRTRKLSICEVVVRAPMRKFPKPLKNTSPTPEPSGTVTVENGTGVRLPSK